MLKKERAFTLIELMIVVVIMLVAAGIAFPRMKRTVEGFEFRSNAQLLRSVMDYAHDRALLERTIMRLDIDTQKNVYRVYAHEDRGSVKSYHVPLNFHLETDKDEVRFYPDGAIDRVNITMKNLENEEALIMTQGVFGGIKLLFK